MRVAILYELPGVSAEQYDQLLRDGFQGRLAPGVVAHAAGPQDDGFWAFDIYESGEAAEQVGAQLGPVLEALGIAGEPRITRREIHNVLIRD